MAQVIGTAGATAAHVEADRLLLLVTDRPRSICSGRARGRRGRVRMGDRMERGRRASSRSRSCLPSPGSAGCC